MSDFIKQIQIGTIPYDIDALRIDNHSWQDIVDLVSAGFTIEAPWIKSDYESTTAPTAEKLATVPAVNIQYRGLTPTPVTTTGTLAASVEETKKHIYLVYHPHESGDDNYDEYVSVGTAANAHWEKIGNTDIDLSGYQQVGKTLTTSTPSSNTTSTAPTATYTTTQGGAQSALGTATISYQKANAATGETNSGTSADTGLAGAATVNGSSFSFTGTTATITVAGPVSGTTVGDHEAQTLTISGSQEIAAHSHTVNISQSTVAAITEINGGSGSFTQGVDTFTPNTPTTLDLTKFDGGSLSGDKTFVKAIDHFDGGSLGGDTTFFKAATVSAGVLSFISGTVEFTPASLGTLTKGTVGLTPAAFTTGFYNVGSAASFTQGTDTHSHTGASVKTAATVSYVTGATLNKNSTVTINGSNFSAALPTLTHDVTDGTISVSVNYQPAGSIGGSVTIASHSHSYVKPTSHTHSISFTATSVSGDVEVAVADHTHQVTVAAHTHDLSNHTHNVTTSNADA